MPKKTNTIPLPSFQKPAAPKPPTEEEIRKRQEAENLARYQQMASGIFLNALHNPSVSIPTDAAGVPDFHPLFEASVKQAQEIMKRLYGVTISDNKEE